MTNTFYVPESAMAIVAHPDDIEFSCAGTTARWAKAGARIAYLLCTSGDVGIAEPSMTATQRVRLTLMPSVSAARGCSPTERWRRPQRV